MEKNYKIQLHYMDIGDQRWSTPSPLNISLQISVFINAPHSLFSQTLHTCTTPALWFNKKLRLLFYISSTSLVIRYNTKYFFSLCFLFLLFCATKYFCPQLCSPVQWLVLLMFFQVETIYEMKNNLLMDSFMKRFNILNYYYFL